MSEPLSGRGFTSGSAVAHQERPCVSSGEPAPADGELLALCREGDSAAWSQLVSRYERLVFTTALHQGLGREDAADVTQIAFVALLDSIGVIKDQQSLPYWLMTVARRQAWRVNRRRSRELPVAEVWGEEEPGVPWEEVAALHEALALLKPSCRELLSALYFDASEPTYAEVALRLDRPVGGIGPLRGRCLDHLRRLLSDPDTA